MLFLTEREVKQLLPMDVAIDLVRRTFRALADGSGQNQPRSRMTLPTGVQLHSMAGAFGEYLGTKVYTTVPRPVADGPHTRFLFALFRASTGELLALFEANELGRIRTGAASGVATELLSNPNASVVGLLGAGYQARTQLHAICSVRAIREVRVFARRAESRARFTEEFREFEAGLVLAAESAAAAVQGADILVTATRASEPILPDAAIAIGTHINAMGSNSRERSELHPETIQRATRIAVDSMEQAKVEAGELLRAYPEGSWPEGQVCEIADLLRATNPAKGRESERDLTIFKSTGLGVQDVAVAGWVYERALATGVGQRLPSAI